MSIGVLYNTFVCFISGFFSLLVFARLRALRKEKEKEYSKGLDYFPLLLGLLWFFVGLRTFFVWLNVLEIDDFIFRWFTGPLTYIHLIPLFYYFGWSFFSQRKTYRLVFEWAFSILVFLTLFGFFKFGFTQGEVGYAGTDPTPNDFSNNIFTYGIFFPIFICIIIEFVRRFRKWRKTKDKTERQLFGFSTGFLVYALMGIFDALGIAQGWFILLVRIGIMIAPLIFYLSATWED